jgi:hypothetical protein
MKALAAIAAATLAVQAPASAASPDRFCIDLKRIVGTAERGGGFLMLQRSRAAPPRLGFRHCFAAAGMRASWYCHQSMAPGHLSLESLAGRTAACLPEARRQPSRDGEAVFTLPYARIRITEDGGPRAHVGRVVSYRVVAERTR